MQFCMQPERFVTCHLWLSLFAQCSQIKDVSIRIDNNTQLGCFLVTKGKLRKLYNALCCLAAVEWTYPLKSHAWLVWWICWKSVSFIVELNCIVSCGNTMYCMCHWSGLWKWDWGIWYPSLKRFNGFQDVYLETAVNGISDQKKFLTALIVCLT